MPSLIQSSGKEGEWAPEYHGRTDLDGYRHALRLARNMLVMPSGGLTRRPGTRWAGAALSSDPTAGKVRLKSFGPSINTQYTLEFSAATLRFYRNKALVPAFSVGTPYAAADLAALGFTKTGPPQTTTVLWVWHPSYAPRQVQWAGGGSPDTSWSVLTPAFLDGPYLDQIGGTTTATPSAAAGSATITLNNTTEVNSGAGFQANDVGRVVRFLCPTWTMTAIGPITAGGAAYQVGDTINPAGGTALLTPIQGVNRQSQLTVSAPAAGGAVTGVRITDGGQYLAAPPGALTQGQTSGIGAGFTATATYAQTGAPVWIWGIITARADATHATVAIQPLWIDAVGSAVRTQAGVFLSTAAITSWKLGAWCATEGFPSCAAVFQGRLVVSGQPARPRREWTSESNTFLSFAPSLSSGQVVASNAVTADLDDDGSDPISWLAPAGSVQIPQLAAGKANSLHVTQPAGSGGALSPTNIQTYREADYGVAAVPPLRVGRLLLFLERGAKKLRQWMYQWAAGGFLGPDAEPYARHLFMGGWSAMDYAQIPWGLIWGCDAAGALSAVTFQFDEKEPVNNINAAASQLLGGSYFGGPPVVESLTVQPSEDSSYDQLWLSVLRDIAGTPSRTIEVLDAPFRGKPLDQAVFMDCAQSSALTFPAATCTPAFTAITDANGTRTLPARGDSVGFTFNANVAVAGDLVPGTVIRINGGTFRLTAVGAAASVTAQCLDPPTSLASQTSALWSYTKMAKTFTGFAVQNGRTVQVLGDGADEGLQLVSGGTVTTSDACSYVTVGLPVAWQIDTCDLDLTAPDGTTQMKTGRLDHIWLRVFESLGGVFGASPDDDNPTPDYDSIDTRDSDDLTNWAPPLVSDDLRLAFPGGSSMHRRVTVKGSGPFPFTLLALVVKGGTNEQAPR